MKYDPKIIEDKYKTLPADIQLAMASTDVSKTILIIADKHDLFLNQADILSDEVSYVMLGLTKSKDFVKNISKSLEIDEKKAIEIAQDINREVFDKMRKSLQQIEAGHEEGYNQSDTVASAPAPEMETEEKMPTPADRALQKSVIEGVEKAGGFVIDKPGEPSAYNKAIEKPVSKAAVLGAIERPNAPIMPRIESSMSPDHLLEDVPEVASRTDSIVDTLLAKGVAMPMDSGASKSATAPKTEQKIRPYDGTDPYRESIK